MKSIQLLLLLLIGQQTHANDTDDAFVLNIVKQPIVEQVDQLNVSLDALQSTLNNYCRQPSQQQLALLKNAFNQTYLSWKHHQSSQWGPIAQLRLERHVDFWPTRTQRLLKLLNDDNIIDQFKRSGVAVKGLPAIEWLLYADPTILEHKNHCPLLKLLLQDSSQRLSIAIQKWRAWSQDKKALQQFQSLAQDDFVYSAQLMEEWVNALTIFIYQTRKRCLITPLGLKTGSKKPERSEAFYSQLSTQALKIRLTTIHDLLISDQYGFIHYLDQKKLPEISNKITSQVKQVQVILDQINQPIEQLVVSQQDLLIKLEQELNDLQYIFEYDVSLALNIVMFFRDLDGD